MNNIMLPGSEKSIEWLQTETELQLNFQGIETSGNGFAVEVEF